MSCSLQDIVTVSETLDLWKGGIMNLLQVLLGLSKASAQERSKGNSSKANGLALIVMGIVLLPIPFIGLPMIGFGFVMLFK
jgi:hypothetical protein